MSGRVPFQPTPIKLPNAHDAGALKSTSRLPQDVAESPNLARTTAQAPWSNAQGPPGGYFSGQLRKHRGRHPVTA